MRFRRKPKTRYLSEGYVAAVVETIMPLLGARVIYGDGKDQHDTVFVLESHDRKWQIIGTFNQMLRLSDQITQSMMEYVYNTPVIDWLGYDQARNTEKGAHNGGQDRGQGDRRDSHGKSSG